MKPAPFEYLAPRTLEEALNHLAEHGDQCKVLAGGQSLIPAMNFRLARPAVLVDINHVAGLGAIATAGGSLRLPALVRHADLERAAFDDPLAGLLRRVARYVGHLPIRTRGTFCGSLAHADPSAEWCATAVALDAEIVATAKGSTRTIPAADFFETVFTTALEPHEMLTEVRLPALGPLARVGFNEFSRRAGDFAMVAALAICWCDGDGTVARCSLAFGGVAGTPVRASGAEKHLIGRRVDEATVTEAARMAAADLDPMEDIHASPGYRRAVAEATLTRALGQAFGERGVARSPS